MIHLYGFLNVIRRTFKQLIFATRRLRQLSFLSLLQAVVTFYRATVTAGTCSVVGTEFSHFGRLFTIVHFIQPSERTEIHALSYLARPAITAGYRYLPRWWWRGGRC